MRGPPAEPTPPVSMSTETAITQTSGNQPPSGPRKRSSATRAATEQFSRLKHLWLDSGYRGEDKGKDWVKKTLGWSVELVERPHEPASKEVLMAWAPQWLNEGVKVDWKKLLPPSGFFVLPRRWVVERSFAWISHNRRMSKDYERLCATGEAFVYAAMVRLMLRPLAHT